ncbi:MAG TPA: aldo/keto reductase [Chitinophagaceae bacterium]|nr:aldo/keto reductase [Chitinophagaceae bacterium]
MNQQLGFGCVSLTAHQSRARAIETLELVFDQGIRHFDVARLYGMGYAEGILGDFIKNKRDQLTVTTKFGLNPPAQAIKNQQLVQTIKKLLKKFPLVNKYVRKKVSQAVSVSQYTPAEAERNLEVSLRELKTDYIDYYLLHEATLQDANKEDIIDFLNKKVQEGKIKKFGLGTSYAHLQDDCNLFHPAHSVFQFENSVLDNRLQTLRNRGGKLVITHSAINKWNTLAGMAAAQPAMVMEYSDKLGVDLREPGNITGSMLLFALQDNPNGKVLFASTNPAHITHNLAFVQKYSGSDFHAPLKELVAKLCAKQPTAHAH